MLRERMKTRKQIVLGTKPDNGKFAGRRVHLIGIGGCGMRAMATMLADCGAYVSGSDAAPGGAVERLTKRGVKVCIGQRAENIPADCQWVIHSAAIHDQNPELVAARQRKLEVLKYAQMLGMLMANRIGIAVSGTHGKSTTTAMVASTLQLAGADPSYVVGATVEQLGGPSGVGGGRHFVAEACEYDRSFLNLNPHLAAILNVDEDHLDCYQNLAAIIEAFRAFAGRIEPGGVLVANGDDLHTMKAVPAESPTCTVETFGLSDSCTWQGTNLSEERGKRRMDVTYHGQKFCSFVAPLPGLHNAYNSLAATALLYHAGLEPERIAELLPQFQGTQRRSTLKACLDGITVVDDYAHHPREIQVTLKSLKEFYSPQRMLCIFQPHQHSRTRFLLKEFAQCFSQCTEVLLPDIYFVRDSEMERDNISSRDLVSQIRLHGAEARYLKTFEEIVTYAKGWLQPGDLVVTMGAGNIWEVADDIVRWLGTDRKG